MNLSKGNGRLVRIGGEHGHQPEMTFVNVLPTLYPTLEPFKISFRRVLPYKFRDYGAGFWAGRKLTKFISGWLRCSPPIRPFCPFRQLHVAEPKNRTWPNLNRTSPKFPNLANENRTPQALKEETLIPFAYRLVKTPQ